MITLEKIPFTSVAGQPLTLYLWQTDAPCRGVIQLVHGMAEHIARYDRLARALCAAGYTVAGHSHLGHGEDAREDELGFFGRKDGWDHLVEDVHAAHEMLLKRFPGQRFAILGHSMGSFVTREYLLRYGGDLTAAVICGTGWFPGPLCSVARAAAALCGVFGGWQKPAPLVDRLMSKDNNKAFAPARTPFDWLSRDTVEVDKYIADPLCGQKASIGLFYEMLGGIRFISTPKNIASMNRNTPILFISGDKDPVGEMGKGVRRAYEAFRRAGVRDVELKLYKGLRHEILNEDCRAVVYNDLWSWIEKHI